jgi:hypothetical protein
MTTRVPLAGPSSNCETLSCRRAVSSCPPGKRSRSTRANVPDRMRELVGRLMKTILVADDDEAQAWRLAYTILGERRYNTLFAASCSDVHYLVQRILPHLLIFYNRSSPEAGLACYDSLAPWPRSRLFPPSLSPRTVSGLNTRHIPAICCSLSHRLR